MLSRWFHWSTVLALVAISIIIGTIFYSNYLSKKLDKEEEQKVTAWVEAQRALVNPETDDLTLATHISSTNDDIPIIETNEKDSLTGNYLNIDSNKVNADSNYLKERLKEFKKLHPPITLILSQQPYMANKYYYGESRLQKEVRYYPIVQLIIFVLFVLIIIVVLRTNYRSVQNKMWVGMAKETAHQLGTPVSSLQAWIEVLRESGSDQKIADEMQKDVSRLQLVSDRFGKIGADPKLEIRDVSQQVQAMVEYIRKRAGKRVTIHYDNKTDHEQLALISPPLFDWVIENLLKNALDAIKDTGNINVVINEERSQIIIDVEDSGKGISSRDLSKIFNPGFTTKKRGWGLGLTLTKRIVEQYHKGQIFVKWSTPGKGTCFRIILNKAS